MRSEEDFLIEGASFLLGLNINNPELSGVQSAVEVTACHHVSMHPPDPRGSRR